nr:hypothetical protein [Pseudomonas fluorescens]
MHGQGGARQPEPEARSVRVEVPVPRKMHEVAVSPCAAAGLNKSDSQRTKVRALLAKRRPRLGYETQLTASVLTCC